MNYSEKLKDPRWQKKRLEILARDNFKCTACQSMAKTLHIHHKYYTYGNETEEVCKQNFNALLIKLLSKGHDYMSLYYFLENADDYNTIPFPYYLA